MKKQFMISTVADLPDVAQQLLASCTDKKIFAFLGEMGAGKTTLITAMCRLLGVKEQVSSPTFAIVNEYRGIERIYHIDLYRLKTIEEALEIGMEDYLSGNDYCFIEWPQLIERLLPPGIARVSIDVVNQSERILTLEQT